MLLEAGLSRTLAEFIVTFESALRPTIYWLTWISGEQATLLHQAQQRWRGRNDARKKAGASVKAKTNLIIYCNHPYNVLVT